MNPTSPSEKKEKSIPIAGAILSVLITVDVFFISCYRIVQACGGTIFGFYKAFVFLLAFAHFFLGLLFIPALLIVFIVQAVRFRKHQKYIRNCAFTVLWWVAAVLIGYLISRVSPVIENTIKDVKIWTYQSTVDKIHRGEPIRQNSDINIGGTKGCEDVAFFQHSPGENEQDNHTFYIAEYYILYSEDSACDVETIMEHAKEMSLYHFDAIEMQEIKENWYWLEVTYQFKRR